MVHIHAWFFHLCFDFGKAIWFTLSALSVTFFFNFVFQLTNLQPFLSLTCKMVWKEILLLAPWKNSRGSLLFFQFRSPCILLRYIQVLWFTSIIELMIKNNCTKGLYWCVILSCLFLIDIYPFFLYHDLNCIVVYGVKMEEYRGNCLSLLIPTLNLCLIDVNFPFRCFVICVLFSETNINLSFEFSKDLKQKNYVEKEDHGIKYK